MKPILLMGVLAISVGSNAVQADEPELVRGANAREVRSMKVRMIVQDRAVTATLVDNETSRDFVSLLPLSLNLRDFAGTEKISELPRKLSTKGAPGGVEPAAADIAYYAPWGNLAIFYKDGDYSKGLIKLGRLDFGIDALRAADSVKVTVEHVE
jgi:hypothetical protein